MNVLDLEKPLKILSEEQEKESSKLNPILPIYPIDYDYNKTSSMLTRLNEKFGFSKFLIVAPGFGVRLTGFPDSEVYRELGVFLLAIKNNLSNTNIQVGWWCAPSLKSGNADYQRITGIDGNMSPISSCPLDSDFRKIFAQNIALVAKIAKPFIIQFEDDYELSNHGPVKFGCFCPLHIKEFSARVGNEYSHKDLLKKFSEVTPESINLRKQWAQMSCDTLADFAGNIRKEIDKVSPETRLSLCQPGCSTFDGDFTQAVATALAGNTTPMVRVHGSTYSCDSAHNIPTAIFNVHRSKESLPEHFELIHESDTYPHTRYFMSAMKLKSLMAAAFSYGMDDSLLYTTQYLDELDEESGYSQMFLAESKRFERIRSEVKKCTPQGCEICFSPASHTAVPYDTDKGLNGRDDLNPWVNILGKYGVPYSVKPGRVKMLAGNYPATLSDQEIKQLLSSGVVMDGKAAHILSQRGFGELIGTEISQGDEVKFWCEKIEDDAGFNGIRGKLMYNFIFAPAGAEGGGFYKMTPQLKAKILTSFCNTSGTPVIPGMIAFENSLGGRIAITAFDLSSNKSASIFNYRKKEILCQTIEWVAQEQLPVYIKNSPNIFCIFNQSQTENKAIVTIINLCSDSTPNIELVLSEQWKNKHLEYLDHKGNWVLIDATAESNSAVLPIELKLMDPVYLKFS